MSEKTARIVLPLILGGVMLVLYLATLCPTVYWRDSAELAWVLPSGGIAHSSGYPLFSLLARLAALIPVGEVAARVNAVAALCGAGAVAVLFLAARELGARALPAAIAALQLGLTSELWLQSTAAEVYSLHALLAATAVLLALRAARSGRALDLFWLGLCCGLSFANHLATFLWAPALLALVWPGLRGGEARFTVSGYLLAPLGLAVGLLPYAYLPIVSAGSNAFDHGNPETLSGLLAHIAGTSAWHRSFSAEAGALASHLGEDLAGLLCRGTPLGLLAGAIGLVLLILRKAGRGVGLWLLVLAALAYASMYQTSDRGWVLLPADVALALGAAVALNCLVRRPWLRERRVLAIAALAVLPLTTLIWRVGANEAGRAGERSLHDYAGAVLAEPAPDAMVLFQDLNVYHAARYLQVFEGRRTDVLAISEYLLPYRWYVEQLRRDDPGLVQTEAIAAQIEATEARLTASDPMQHGSVYLDALERVAEQLVSANLDRRPVFHCPATDAEPITARHGRPAAPAGLTYRLGGQQGPAGDFELEHLPRPDGHRRPGLTDPGARAASRRYAAAFNRRAVLRAQGGRFGEAEQDLLVALEYDSGFANPYKNLGLLYAGHLGQPGAAREALRRYLELRPEDESARLVLQGLGRE